MAIAVGSFLFAAVAVLSGIDTCVLARSTSSPAEHNVGEPFPSYAVSMLSDEGSKLLKSALGQATALRLLANLETQKTQTYCGIATTVTALNSIEDVRSNAPLDPLYYPYKFYTQDAIFNSKCALDAATPAAVLSMGVTLPELASFARCYHPGKVTAVHASDRYSSVASMRDALIDALKSDDTRIMMNYLRKEYNGGHWSPIGAYNADKDMFLVVDVERYLYPPLWLPASVVFDAVTTTDSTSGKSRGFVILDS